jgi:thioesterase domain-containing protein
LKPGAVLTASELRSFVATHLADFKVPRLVHFVEQLPKGPTGKLQRVGLAGVLGVGSPNVVCARAETVPPHSTLERELAQVWARVLGVSEVGIHDDFFTLGGDSLAATELLLQAAEILDADIPYVEFVEQPTIAGILAGRGTRSPGSRSTRQILVPIQTQGSGPPILCTPGHDNRLWMISPVIRHLGKDRPVYGLRTPAVDAAHPYRSLEEIVEHGLAMIEPQLVDRRCDIIGPCFGAMLAWEMACRLEQCGVNVDLLVLIDPPHPTWRVNNPELSPAAVHLHNLSRRVQFHRTLLRQADSRGRLAHLEQRARYFAQHWWTAGKQLLYNQAVARRWPLPVSLLKTSYANRRAAALYRPAAYGGRVLLIGCRHPAGSRLPLPQMGFGRLLTGEVAEAYISCERHLLWRDPNVGQLAAVIRDHLEQRSAPAPG